MPKTKQLALAGLLLAVLILFERFIAIETQFLRVSLAYIPYALAGWLLGPLWSCMIGMSADLLGMLLMPKAAFFAGFTLNAILTGLIYGLFLHKRPVDKRFPLRLVLCILIVHICVNLGLTTLWLSIMYKKAFMVIITSRLIANAVAIPLEFSSLLVIMRFLQNPVNRYLKDSGEDGGFEDENGGPPSGNLPPGGGPPDAQDGNV